ncbi:hypothetical protein PR048_019256 [Dryococelus australis]|uniref:Clathrin/coatomer adaptor adaptin-like N-terminal domain-containing protein n=1 Tax=Dryococelus australis TaxID=614101 RepID=A0ABQ9H2Z4_9NEOP|nr:hypothetical protein PR048_019256 [Dryococelus australis]
MVVSNTVAALSELSPLAELLPKIQWKLLASLDKCTEWGRVNILDTLSSYVPVDEAEAKTICQIISPHLAHKNSSVVVAVVRIIMKLMPVFEDRDFVSSLEEKLPGAMVAFLSSEPEIQFVVLQEIQNIVRQRPNIFQSELRSFFIKYNDPIYVKLGKLHVINHLIRAENVLLVLFVLKDYLLETDEEFVRVSIRVFGNCAAVVESYSLPGLWALKNLARIGVGYVSQEAIVAIQNILRAHPVRHGRIVAMVCENLPPLTYPEAKASAIWMVGEYAEVVDNAAEILDDFLEGFLVESPLVQLQLLTSVIKVFLKKPHTSHNLVTQTLNMCTKEVENPDLRDRGFFYKRLLSVGSEIAKQVVLHSELPVHKENQDTSLDFGYTRLS